mgnify:CR=1 FL=1
MKLIGSMAEDYFKKELKEGNEYLLEKRGDPMLMELLHREIGSIESAYFLSGYRLSNYHVCNLLVNGVTVCHVEISDGELESFEKISVSEYKNGLKRRDQIKLQLAIELAGGK